MVYFVDSVYGNNQNDGASRQTAFQSPDAVNTLKLRGGDSVLFKAGCVYKGQLCPKRDDSVEMIIISRYGTGEKPLISAQKGDAVDLCDFGNTVVSDLAVINPDGIRGILIRNTLGGSLKNITIKNCDIFNINEAHEHFAYESGGIICTAFAKKPAWFEGLVLEDNKITDVCRTGILVTSLWANRPKAWGRNEYVSDSENWWPSTGIEIRGNYIDRTGGDGIVIIGTVNSLIEWNTVYHVMTRPKSPCANAGIWPQSSNGCVMQYNEVGYCQKPEGCSDAQGFDVDLSCRDTLIQNNYSHDNAGGFLLLCERSDTTDKDEFRGTVVRNNLSVNDGNVMSWIYCAVLALVVGLVMLFISKKVIYQA